ncbi:MAG: GAF domain-containing sensor histidine kinase [Desulfitobacterium sp.]
MRNSLEQLLLEISLLIERCELKAQEVPLIVTQLLQAKGCAIYLRRDDESYILSEESSLIPFSHNWQQYTKDIPESVQYLSEPEKISSILRHKDWQRTLIMPFKGESTTEGILLAYWSGPSPLDDLDQREFSLLQPIANQLAIIYYWQPKMEKMRLREESLTTIFHIADQTLEDDRKRIARKLSYEVVQDLTSIVLQTKLLQDSVDFEYVQGRLGGIRHIVSQTIEEVRSLVHSQRPILLDKLGLHAVLNTYVQEFMERTKIHVELILPDANKRFAEQVEVLIFRSVQEALAICVSQVGVSETFVKLSMKGNNLFLCISYLGKITIGEKDSGVGILAMKERIKKQNGELWIMKHNEQYQSLNILLPLS